MKDLSFIDACHEIDRIGLIRTSSGNLSQLFKDCRIDDYISITRTGAWLGRVDSGDITNVDLRTGSYDPIHNYPPSSEVNLHRGVYLVRDDVGSVLHFQSPYVTALAAVANLKEYFPIISEKLNIIPEFPFYIQKIGMVDYNIPSQELADKVADQFKEGCNIVLMKNHGATACGKNLEDVIHKAYFFELACQSYYNNNGSVDIIFTEFRNKLVDFRNSKKGV